MPERRAVYRGYAIYISATKALWRSRIERIYPDVPIISVPVSDGHGSWELALSAAQQEIDSILSIRVQ